MRPSLGYAMATRDASATAAAIAAESPAICALSISAAMVSAHFAGAALLPCAETGRPENAVRPAAKSECEAWSMSDVGERSAEVDGAVEQASHGNTAGIVRRVRVLVEIRAVEDVV